VAERLALVLSRPLALVAETTSENARRLFGITR
jgi:Tat protein secretion system quality control protein TatD with DNase activity